MQNSKIQWTNATVNFWTGCTKISPGCKFCYMYRDKERYGHDPRAVLRTKDKTFYSALQWKEPKLIFTCSWSDFFIEEADQWRADAWDVIRKSPHHTWQILTKRPERIAQCLPPDWGDGWDNVMIGVSAENGTYFDQRVPLLLAVPAKVKFLSLEPLLAPINIDEARFEMLLGIDWMIIGGESGNDNGKYRYRQCELRWILDLICAAPPTVRVFLKQLGTHLSKQLKLKDRHGGEESEWPEEFRHSREMPFPVKVKSPFSINGMATLKKAKEPMEFRGEIFEILYLYYRCNVSGEEYTTMELEKINQLQVLQKYGTEHGMTMAQGRELAWEQNRKMILGQGE